MEKKCCENCNWSAVSGEGLTHWLSCWLQPKKEVDPLGCCNDWEAKDD